MTVTKLEEEEKQLLRDLGLSINWDSISNDEWEKMIKRNEASKKLDKLNKDKQTEE